MRGSLAASALMLASCGAAQGHYAQACDRVATLDSYAAALSDAIVLQAERSGETLDVHVVNSMVRLSEQIERAHDLCFEEPE